jgi:hypothetical protein
MSTPTIRPGETLVYSTRWFDDASDEVARRGQCPKGHLPAKPHRILRTVINDERHEALAKRQSLSGFLKGAVRSHAGACL